jgi:hypothetical protein
VTAGALVALVPDDRFIVSKHAISAGMMALTA